MCGARGVEQHARLGMEGKRERERERGAFSVCARPTSLSPDLHSLLGGEDGADPNQDAIHLGADGPHSFLQGAQAGARPSGVECRAGGASGMVNEHDCNT